MARFRVVVRVQPRAGLLDPQGEAVAAQLRAEGGSDVRSVRLGRLVELELDAVDGEAATARAQALGHALLAHPAVETFVVEPALPLV